jgi:hypothetical protein
MQSSWKSRGGIFGVLAKFFLGGYLGLSESREGGPGGPLLFFPLFVAFLCDNFSDLTPLPPPLCVHLWSEKREREKDRLGKLGRLGLCVCQTKNPMQRWVQQLVPNKFVKMYKQKTLTCCIEGKMCKKTFPKNC